MTTPTAAYLKNDSDSFLKYATAATPTSEPWSQTRYSEVKHFEFVTRFGAKQLE